MSFTKIGDAEVSGNDSLLTDFTPSKTGETMKFVTICDYIGIIDCEIFADAYRIFGINTARYPVIEVTRKCCSLQNGILQKNKFEKLILYRCVNLFYLVTPESILANYELPLAWDYWSKKVTT